MPAGPTSTPAPPARRPGRPPGPRPDPTRRRTALLDAAEQAIRTLGADVSMEDIAASAGMAKPALYAAFADKSALAEALADRAAVGLGQRITVALSRPVSPRDGLAGAIDEFAAFAEHNAELFRFLVGGAAGFGRRFSERRLLVVVSQFIEVVLSQALSGAGRDSAPAKVWSRALIGTIFFAADWWLDDSSVSRPELVDSLTDFIWSGVQGGGAPPAPGR